MALQPALEHVVAGRDLSRDAMREVMTTVMTGEASDAQIGALLVALRMKGEAIDEITGAAEVMRELVTPVALSGEDSIDLVGTGGDGANLFNVSTAATFVAAAGGARVAKHGNRSVSSSSGSSDVLEALGVSLRLTPDQIAKCIESVGMGFMFAPTHHSAMEHAIRPRKELGMRTLFNVLGPLTNPALVRRQVVGVFDSALCEPLAKVLQQLGSVHALVLHSEDGLDEISIAAPTHGFELKDNQVLPVTIQPGDYGHDFDSLDGLQVSAAADSANLIRSALDGATEEHNQKARAIIAINAGAGIYVSGRADSLAAGVSHASEALSSGGAALKLMEFVSFTRALSSESNARSRA